uniref:Uncharacterized protein n=1 Tax=Rhizophora mucronata TaxID=61149 RepID=A0A2P2QF24_RHIMU
MKQAKDMNNKNLLHIPPRCKQEGKNPLKREEQEEISVI